MKMIRCPQNAEPFDEIEEIPLEEYGRPDEEVFLRGLTDGSDAVSWLVPNLSRCEASRILRSKEVGNFLVRESESCAGSYVMSVRVPLFNNSAGVAHYLLLRTKRGVKFKGFHKEWPSLSSLVIHHSILPEFLPCLLRVETGTCISSQLASRNAWQKANFYCYVDYAESVSHMSRVGPVTRPGSGTTTCRGDSGVMSEEETGAQSDSCLECDKSPSHLPLSPPPPLAPPHHLLQSQRAQQFTQLTCRPSTNCSLSYGSSASSHSPKSWSSSYCGCGDILAVHLPSECPDRTTAGASCCDGIPEQPKFVDLPSPTSSVDARCRVLLDAEGRCADSCCRRDCGAPNNSYEFQRQPGPSLNLSLDRPARPSRQNVYVREGYRKTRYRRADPVEYATAN